jgi:hypothetical protein
MSLKTFVFEGLFLRMSYIDCVFANILIVIFFQIRYKSGIHAKTLIKPKCLWKINIFDYNIVFSRNNRIHFVKDNGVD